MEISIIISSLLSVIALVVSMITMWLTLLRKGTVRMTTPTQIYFGPDSGGSNSSKVYFRTLLYATSKKGRVIENFYVRLKRGESKHNFNIWVYDPDHKLTRGSGLYVGETGIAAFHHFLLLKDAEKYNFQGGQYTLEVYVRLVGDKADKLLHTTTLSISEFETKQMAQQNKGIYFDWEPDSKQYHTHVDTKSPQFEDTLSVLEKVL